MKKEVLGHIDCPVCTFKTAQIKEDKNGHAYMHCADCNAQLFTRSDERDTLLRRRMRAVTVTVTEPEPLSKPAPPAAPVTVTKPAQLVQKPAAPVTKPAPAQPDAKPVKSAWLSPVLGGANG
jgi:hypothetical protein